MLSVPLITLLVGQAGAYSYKMDDAGNQLAWETTPIPVAVNTAGLEDVTGDDALIALEDAIADFSDSGHSELRFDLEAGEAPRAVDWQDGINSIFFTDDWREDDTLLAMTYTWYEDGGEIIGFDMAVNLANHAWSTDGEADFNDLHNTLAHELGHAAGLGHSDVPEATMFATTFPGELTKRGLHDDDKEALGGLYGEMGFDQRRAFACSTGGAGFGGSAPLLLSVMAIAGLMARRSDSDPESTGEAA